MSNETAPVGGKVSKKLQMDFNDLNSKLKRLYSSLGEHYSEDIANNIVDKQEKLSGDLFAHHITFGTNELEKNQNLVMGIIHLVGSLKDIIKKKTTEAGGNPNSYDALIDRSLSLALITDLDNKDKHGDPLTRPARSGRDPRIVNIAQVLHGKGPTNIQFTTNFETGKTTLDSVKGDVKVVVTADIIDSSGQVIMTLDKMLEESISEVERYIKDSCLI